MYRPLRPFAVALSALILSAGAVAAEVGWRQIQVPASAPGSSNIPVALYYPTSAPARPVVMGPFTVHAAMSAPADKGIKGLIVLSHGTGGSELGHSSLAQALARHGYLVAAPRHPGDNWQDRSLLQKGAAAYFGQRPQQLSQVIDALLKDPSWGPRITSDTRGPRVGALGHSAGGYSVLALAGGAAEPARLLDHCSKNRARDPIFCSIGGSSTTSAPSPATSEELPARPDRRVRAVVALAPVGVVFSPQSLQGIAIPVAIYQAQRDRFLVPRFHSQWINRHLPSAEMHSVRNAWHFAFMDKPGMAIATEDGDLAADPPGFNRAAFLEQLGKDLPVFFDKAFQVDR